MQATELRGKVAMLAKLEGALWVSSPLTRAIETMLLSCPKADLIGKQHDDAERGAVKVSFILVNLILFRIKIWFPCNP